MGGQLDEGWIYLFTKLNDGFLFLEIQQGDMVILVLHFKFVRATDIWTPNQGIVGTIL